MSYWIVKYLLKAILISNKIYLDYCNKTDHLPLYKKLIKYGVKMEQIFIFSCIAGALAIIYGFITARQVLSMPAGTKKMQEISNAIQIGASAYLKRQYYTIALVGIIIFIIIAFFKY